MVGGFPARRTPPKVAEVSSPIADAGHDEDGLIITEPLTPAPTRPSPSYARQLPPMPCAPKPGGLPQRPVAPVKPTTKRAGPLPPPKAAAPAPTAVKRPPPPTPYVRKPAAQYLDPETIPFDPPPRWR